MGGLTRNWSRWILAAAIFAAVAAPLQAQDPPGAPKAKTTSVFEIYFFSGDAFGIAQIWLLVVMSIATVALTMKHTMDNRLSVVIPDEMIAEYEELLEQKQFREAIERAATDESPFGQMVHASLSQAANGYAAMEQAIGETADLIASKRSRSLELLNVLGATGPMIGLFGTVYGMIVAFQALVDAGGQPNPADLAKGISTALVTTFWGLIVGIPAVAAVAMIRAKIDDLMLEATIRVEALIVQFQPARKTAAAPAAAGAPAKTRAS